MNFLIKFVDKVLKKVLVPNMEECYSLVWHEVVLHTTLNKEAQNIEASAMVARNLTNPTIRPNNPNSSNVTDKSAYKCTHRKQNGHTKSRYFEFVS
ncbi:hypothetical protein PanWU01x14_217420 [Parasponia andersonii]|uniref:Uncharacterized protein n=1 Tax=Parasponia andersonii TaxID=3476 RepID=A0A2P5BR49_PARAD|nr:hypothetical protein PanWU01x14_217420 [Parasponia andersonii]